VAVTKGQKSRSISENQIRLNTGFTHAGEAQLESIG
jgi:hypothetical protein